MACAPSVVGSIGECCPCPANGASFVAAHRQLGFLNSSQPISCPPPILYRRIDAQFTVDGTGIGGPIHAVWTETSIFPVLDINQQYSFSVVGTPFSTSNHSFIGFSNSNPTTVTADFTWVSGLSDGTLSVTITFSEPYDLNDYKPELLNLAAFFPGVPFDGVRYLRSYLNGQIQTVNTGGIFTTIQNSTILSVFGDLPGGQDLPGNLDTLRSTGINNAGVRIWDHNGSLTGGKIHLLATCPYCRFTRAPVDPCTGSAGTLQCATASGLGGHEIVPDADPFAEDRTVQLGCSVCPP